jgi:cytochrome c oxidase subunit II
MSLGCSRGRLGSTALAAPFMLGCATEPAQSMLHPAGPAAAEIAWLWWVMFGAFTAVFVLVMVLLVDAFLRRPTGPVAPGIEGDEGPVPRFGPAGYIVAGGIVLPVMVLTPLYLLSLKTSASLSLPRDAITIRVVGHMWWWEVRYPGHGIVTANEIHVPVGKPVRLELASADVIHSFWVPRLHGKRDLIPGKENVFSIQADRPGIYRGQCGEYCGTQHANMAFQVIALPQDQFDAWLAERTRPRPRPATAEEQRGLAVFMKSGCVQCHAVGGTEAQGRVGPDLTHLAGRRMIGAAMLPNTRGNLAGWIADPQAIKPGIKMPRSFLAADDLADLLTYLESLK